MVGKRLGRIRRCAGGCVVRSPISDTRQAPVHNLFPTPNISNNPTTISDGISYVWGAYSVDGNTTNSYPTITDHPVGYTQTIRSTRTASATNAWGVYPQINITQTAGWMEGKSLYASVWIRSSINTSVAVRMERAYANNGNYNGKVYPLTANTWQLVTTGPFIHTTTGSSDLRMAFTAYIVAAGTVGDWVEMTGMLLCETPTWRLGSMPSFSLPLANLKWQGTVGQSASIGYPALYA